MENILNACIAILLAHLALGFIMWLRVRQLYSYPGLLGFPIFGNVFYFYKTLFIGFMDSMEKHMISVTEKYGENGLCFHWIYGFRKAVIVYSPNVVKELAFHPKLVDKPKCMYRGFRIYGGGLFAYFYSDELWKLKRKDYHVCLKRSRVEGDYSNTFIKHADKLIHLLSTSTSTQDAHYKISSIVQSATLEALFGLETTLVYHPDIVKTMIKMTNIGSFIMANPKLSEIILTFLRPIDRMFFNKLNELRNLIIADIDEKLALEQSSLQGKPSLSLLIKSSTTKHNQSETTIAELQEVFFIATDTITSALSNSIIFLSVLPDIQKKAWKEQFEIFGNDSREPTIEDLERMQFLDRFIKEALRFLSPPFIGKFATEDINIDGITIPSGSNIIFLLRYMRMDPKYWKKPEVFDPDRFIDDNETLKHSYMPFGIGIRNCPGAYYATLQLKIILSQILRRLKLKIVDKDFKFENILYESCIMTLISNPPLLCIEERT